MPNISKGLWQPYRYLWRRLIHRQGLYIGLFVGCTITLLQSIDMVKVFGTEDAEKVSVFARWFESFTGSPLPGLFWTIFPLIVALPMASILIGDSKQNYLYLVQVKGHIQQYFSKVFKFNFLVGGVVGLFPLILNLYVGMMVYPSVVKPNLIVDGDGNITINQFALTLFPALYYSNPFMHTLLYLLIAFLVGGLLASVALSVSVWVNSVFVTSISAFALIYVIQLLAPLMHLNILNSIIPTAYANQVGNSRNYSFIIILSSYLVFLIVTWILYWYGGGRYATHRTTKV